MASREERTELIKLMLESGSNPNGYRKQDVINWHYEPYYTALTLATRKNYFEIIPLIVSYGGSLEGMALKGAIALHEATENESIQGMSILLELKADVNGTVGYGHYYHEGSTALHVAVRNRYSVLGPEVVDLLLDHRANVDAKTTCGKTVLDVAWSNHTKHLLWRIRQQYLLFVECYSGMVENHIARYVTDEAQARDICEFL
jgi:ankyrin repeat protein